MDINKDISDFEAFERHLVTFETTPSVTGGLLPELATSNWAIKHAFNESSLRLIHDPQKGDIVGMAVNKDYEQKSATLYGTFEGNFNPTNIFQMAETFMEESLATKKEMDSYCAVMGIAFEQDAVPYMKAERGRDENTHLSFGIQLEFEKEFDSGRFRVLSEHFREHAQGIEFTVVDNNSVRFVNFRGDDGVPYLIDDSSFVSRVIAAAETIPFDETVSVQRLRVSGNYIFNDWEVNPNGETYKQILVENGREDLVELAYDIRSKFIEHVKDFAKEYGMIISKEVNNHLNSTGLDYVFSR